MESDYTDIIPSALYTNKERQRIWGISAGTDRNWTKKGWVSAGIKTSEKMRRTPGSEILRVRKLLDAGEFPSQHEEAGNKVDRAHAARMAKLKAKLGRPPKRRASKTA